MVRRASSTLYAYLAHAGGPDRRERIGEGLVTADKISAAIKTLVRATEAVSAYVLYAGGRLNGLTPVAQFDQFEHLGKPAIRSGQESNAAALWDALRQDRDTYAEAVEQELISPAKAVAA